MNNLQKTVSMISGYDRDLDMSSARDDFYYDECETHEEKKSHIASYGVNVDDITLLSSEDISKIYLFLETEFENENQKWHAFENLI